MWLQANLISPPPLISWDEQPASVSPASSRSMPDERTRMMYSGSCLQGWAIPSWSASYPSEISSGTLNLAESSSSERHPQMQERLTALGLSWEDFERQRGEILREQVRSQLFLSTTGEATKTPGKTTTSTTSYSPSRERFTSPTAYRGSLLTDSTPYTAGLRRQGTLSWRTPLDE